MRPTIAVLAALFVMSGASAQVRTLYGPFSDAEAQLLSAVWSEVREAARYEDINWPNHGINRAPGNREVQRIMSANWAELRNARRFEEIDWDDYVAAPRTTNRDDRGDRERSSERFERQFPGPFVGYGPFTRDESQTMAELWSQIREAARFTDIDWRGFGLARAPGDAAARDIMAAHWGELRREQRFQDIDWDDVVDDADLRTSRERQYAGGFGAGYAANPFSREEQATMSRVWGQIRTAGNFADIDWRTVGFMGPPGSRDARRIMAEHWGTLREAARFEDIDWAATTGQPRRVLR